MPQTKLGKWAGAFLGIFFVFLLIFLIFVNVLGFRQGSTELRVSGIFTMIAGIATFVSGAVSMFKFKDRSLLVITATVIGFIAFLLLVLELLEVIT